MEFFSQKHIPRTRNFYKKCPDGTYAIPEVG
jgi:hypothetical protein